MFNPHKYIGFPELVKVGLCGVGGKNGQNDHLIPEQ